MGKPWHNSDDTLSVTLVAGDARYHVVVEPLPRQDQWDWIVWRAGDATQTTRHAVAPTAEAAMQAAKTAVRHWDDDATLGSAAAA